MKKRTNQVGVGGIVEGRIGSDGFCLSALKVPLCLFNSVGSCFVIILQMYNKKVYNAEGLAEKLISEAQGYAVERINNAIGDIAHFDAMLKEYNKAPNITKKRLYLETMERVLAEIPDKMIIDSKVDGVLPLLNLDKKGVKK